ncbi:hypothetical protein G0U57_017733 [Chelydra serpentina]|uniref:Beta-defensin-like domain-containing protein n=1 Tax=Chelydra serpentina TaxID=8475 RepID=A0A8T1T052_CHESE|nr:hypothetical protein G0U57_017733 [Chelydra serpentina]
MKTLYLLFAVACLVFHARANPKPVPEDVPKNLDAVEDDGIGVEDVDVAEAPGGQANPMVCTFSGGTCRLTSCASNEVTSGRCSPREWCCVRY